MTAVTEPAPFNLAAELEKYERPSDFEPRPRSNGKAGIGMSEAPLGNGQATGDKLRCPFHDDDTPSLQIYTDHYHCFGCGNHGPLSDLPEGWAQPACAAAAASDTLAPALRLWKQAKPIAGTPADRYLAEVRGIELGALPPGIDEVLRFHCDCPFNGQKAPCLLALFRDVETDEPAGIHRIAVPPAVFTGAKVASA